MKHNVVLDSLITSHSLERLLASNEEVNNAKSLWFDRNPKTLPSSLASCAASGQRGCLQDRDFRPANNRLEDDDSRVE